MVEFLGKTSKRLSNPIVLSAGIAAVLIYSGAVAIPDRHPPKSLVSLERTNTIEGRICRNTSLTSSGKFYTTEIDMLSAEGKSRNCIVRSSASGRIKILVPAAIVEALYPEKLYSISDGKVLFEPGEKVRVKGKISGDLFMVEESEYLGHSEGFLGKTGHFRALCRLKFKRLMASWGKAGGLALSLLSGSREYLDKKTAVNFRKAGLSHILALSGMHLSFFAGLAGAGGTRILGKRHSFWIRLFGILIFVWFAGLSPSLLRALICSILSLACGLLFCRESDLFKILCMSFLIHCQIVPSDAFTPAFLLSYSALGGILLFSDLFAKFWKFIPSKKISDLFAASSGAQAATAPLSVMLFGCFQPFGILATAVMTLPVNIFMCASCAFIPLCLMFPKASFAAGVILKTIYTAIEYIAAFFSEFPIIE